MVAGILLGVIATASSGLAAGRTARKKAPRIPIALEEREGPGDAAEWWHAQRAYPASDLPDTLSMTGYQEWQLATQTLASGGSEGAVAPAPPQWTLIGPAGLDYAGSGTPNMGPAAGRLTAFALDPTSVNTMYAGFALGGVWKSTDGGASWKGLTDTQPTLAVGAIALDPRNSSTVYVGTGEGNYSGDSFFGQGILKSTDAGTTWTIVGADTFRGLSIARMFADTAGAVYVGVVQGVGGTQSGCTQPQDVSRRGLYKSTDGGAHWTQLVASRAITDFEIDTTATPRRGFLTEYKVGAFSFSEATTPATVMPVNGLPSATSNGPINRIELARSKSNPQVLYAGVGIDTSTSPMMEEGQAQVWRSLNGGATWTRITNAPDYCGDQCMYDNVVEVDPTNPGTVYFGGSTCSVYKLTGGDGATPTWALVSLPPGMNCTGSNWTRGNVHSDAHAIVFHPTDANQVFVGSDGGLAKTLNGGGTWTHLNTGISTLQFYDLCVDPNDDTYIVGGLQDNGFVQMPRTGNTLFWKNFQTGDGTTCAMNLADPTAANRYVLSSTQFASIQRRTSLTGASTQVFAAGPDCSGVSACGDRVAFVPPITNDPSAPLNVYVGTYRVWKSSNGGATVAGFRPISPDLTNGQPINCTNGRVRQDVLTTIAVAPSSSQRIYTGAYTGRVSTTADGGATWTNITKPPLPGRYVSALAVDATKPETVYVAFTGFNAVTPSAPGHIFKSTNAGATWTRFDMGLDPLDVPVSSIRTHPGSSDILFAGHDLGVVATGDGGKTWQPVGTGFPNVAVTALRYYEKTSKLYAATHGRSAWSIQFAPSLLAAPSALQFVAKPGQNPMPQTVTVNNGDTFGTTLQFTAAAAGGAWLSVNPGTGKVLGAVGQPLAVTVDAAGVALGEYDATINLSAMNATPASVSVPVHLSITPTGILPDAGSDGTSTGTGGSTSGSTGSGGSSTGGTSTGSVGPSGTTSGANGGDDSGCGCRIGRGPEGSSRAFVAMLFAMVGAAGVLRRRRMN